MPSLVPCVRIPGPGKRRTSDPAAAERRARVTDNWDLNRDQVLLLQQYKQEFPAYQEELERQLRWLERHSKKISPTELQMARKVFEGSKQQISSLIQTRLLELGKVDERATAIDDPNDPVSSSSSSSSLSDPPTKSPSLGHDELAQLAYIPAELRTQITEQSALLLWEDAKKMLTTQRKIYEAEELKSQRKPRWPSASFSTLFTTSTTTTISTSTTNNDQSRFDHLMASKYAFKILDFLVQNQLITLQSSRAFFHDLPFVQTVISYSLARIKAEVGAPYWKSIDHLTAHWYWPSLNKVFSALGKKEESIIDFVFHVGKLKALVHLSNGIESTDYFYSAQWAEFSKQFPWRKCFERLGEDVGHQSGTEASLSRLEHGDHQIALHDPPIISRKHPQECPAAQGTEEEEMERLIRLLVTTRHSQGITIPKFGLRLYRTETINLFEFMNNALYPGIVSKLVKNEEFERIMHDSIGLVDQKHERAESLFYLSLLYSRYHSLVIDTQSYLNLLATTLHARKSKAPHGSFAQLVEQDPVLAVYSDRFDWILAHYKKLYNSIHSLNPLLIHHLDPKFRELYLSD
ncbi:hypothetical protein PGT21_035335 [Puccinia graminis f. sp. tritici]|uniref:Uncharacterized protein n=1 Tax=Puccinia graminis f. sp. tritici TaxID=56615 RepID=A0A5B0PMD9_PUCGR|nr:hypothetical protein PGT21_035335 [Puccinia graminis f. sp. tritici]